MQAIGSIVRGATNSVKGAANSIVSRIVAWITSVFGWIRAQITPFRLVIAGVVTMLIATGVLAVRTRGLDQAQETLRVEFTAGEEALEEDDLVLANQHFKHAAAAADHLQSFDVRSRLARQMFQETTAIARLAPNSILDMLEEADAIVAEKTAEAWTDQFRAKYEGTWIVLQAPLRTALESEQPASLVVELPLLIGESGHSVSLAAGDVEPADLGLSSEPRVTFFAATLKDCVFNERHQSWNVTLDGDSCFLWTDIDNLRRLGFLETDWISEEETAELLEAQSKLLELK